MASHNFCSRSERRCSQSKPDELARKTDLDCRVVCGSVENEERESEAFEHGKLFTVWLVGLSVLVI